jgi:hypothetical protein
MQAVPRLPEKPMKPTPIHALAMAAACGGAWGADFAPVGAKATLSVTYRFESAGSVKGSPDGVYQLREWRVARSAQVVAELDAKKPQPLSTMQAPEAGQMAKLQQQQAQAQKASKQMAPLMADAQAVVARCGDDEKCIEREVMKMGAGLAGTQQLDDTLKTGRETAAVMQPGADRYQRWQGRTQKVDYALDENWHVVHADPICMSLPKGRCTHDMTRKGGSEMAPTASAAAVEVDARGTAVLQLPVPHGVLACVETHSTDEPAGTHDHPTPKGPQPCQMPLRVGAEGKSNAGVLTVPLKGGWRSLSGEYVVSLGAGSWHGVSGEPGKLTVRWRFAAQ